MPVVPVAPDLMRLRAVAPRSTENRDYEQANFADAGQASRLLPLRALQAARSEKGGPRCLTQSPSHSFSSSPHCSQVACASTGGGMDRFILAVVVAIFALDYLFSIARKIDGGKRGK